MISQQDMHASSNRPIIGIAAQGSPDSCHFVLPEYFDYIQEAGGIPYVISPVRVPEDAMRALAAVDGLVLPGGNDVDPTLYGQAATHIASEPIPARDVSELLLVKAARAMDIPVLGICRGMQIMSIAAGGDLIQDINTAASEAGREPFNHRCGSLASPLTHPATVDDQGFCAITGMEPGNYDITSIHHQAAGTIPEGLHVGAVAPDGTVEALYDPCLAYFTGVQWHPELTPHSPDASALAKSFLAAAQARHDKLAQANPASRPALQPSREVHKLNSEYLSYIYDAQGDGQGRRDCLDYMMQSTAVYKGNVIYSSYYPKLFDKVTYRRLKNIAATTYGIIEKVMRRYLEDPSYREIFDFDPRMVELICLPRHYDSLLPFARIDLFLDEDTLAATFCEFNADGSSGMNENREVTNSILMTAPYQRFAARHKVQDVNHSIFEGWVREFIRIYRTYDKAVEAPHFAMVDYLENSVIEEFKIYRELFAREGFELSIYDIRDLAYEDGQLIGRKPFAGLDNAPIHGVWRRCVSNDVLEFWDESQAFIQAVKENACALIGTFAGHIVHDKQIFKALFDQRTRSFLTSEECRFVDDTFPYTQYLDSQLVDVDGICADPWNWIIKPTDGYGCQDVFPGPRYMAAPQEWAEIVRARADGKSGVPFLAQRYCHPYKTPAVPLYQQEEDVTRPVQYFNNLEGLYLIDGQFGGVFCRLGPNPLILGREGGVTAATLFVDLDDGEFDR